MTFKSQEPNISIVSGMRMKNQQNIPFVHLKCMYFLNKEAAETKLFEWIEIFNYQYL